MDHASRLVLAVQALSLARDLDGVTAVVRREARAIAGADGATFVLRDGEQCFYADEEAIAPLWKGKRFPMAACISGWSMLHREAVVIEDIYRDDRIPQDAYRPTFVKSLAMMPIRTAEPIGAIGVYWAAVNRPSEGDLGALRALADSTAIAMENVRIRADLERRVAERTTELEQALATIRTIRGLVPLCAWCHVRVMDQSGSWIRLEKYLKDNTHGEVSHGICMECELKVRSNGSP